MPPRSCESLLIQLQEAENQLTAPTKASLLREARKRVREAYLALENTKKEIIDLKIQHRRQLHHALYYVWRAKRLSELESLVLVPSTTHTVNDATNPI